MGSVKTEGDSVGWLEIAFFFGLERWNPNKKHRKGKILPETPLTIHVSAEKTETFDL